MMKSELLEQYAPYHYMQEFHDGWSAYELEDFDNPHDLNSVACQAFDRGMEAAMRWSRRGLLNYRSAGATRKRYD